MDPTPRKFQVIQGGLLGKAPKSALGSTEAAWARKLAQLQRIRTVVDTTTKIGAWGPRKSFSAELGAITVVAGLAVGATFNVMGVSVRPLVFFGMPLLLSLAAYLLAMHLSKRPLTLTMQLDHLLHAYDPVNLEAYRMLQKRTRVSGSLEAEYVREWLDVENYALQRAAGWLKPVDAGFVSRTI